MTTRLGRGERGAVSAILLVMLGLVAAAFVFAIVGLSVGLTKGSPSEDKKRAATLERQVGNAKQDRSAAVVASQDAVTKADRYQSVFQQMLSARDQMVNHANQLLAAGMAGNADQYNSLIPQMNSALQQHDAIETQLSAVPRP